MYSAGRNNGPRSSVWGTSMMDVLWGVRPDVVGVEGKTRVRDMEVKTFKFSFQQQLLKCEHHT